MISIILRARNEIGGAVARAARDVENLSRGDRAAARSSETHARQRTRDNDAISRSLDRLSNSSNRAFSALGRFLRPDNEKIRDTERRLRSLGDALEGNRLNVARLDNQLRGLLVLGVITFAQEMVSALVALSGMFVAVGAAAVQAGAAIGGAFVAGAAQAIPVIGLLLAAFGRIGAVFKAVQQSNKAATAAAGDNTAAMERQRNAANRVRQAQEQLAEAQRRVRESQEGLTEAREKARRELEDLADAEKRARVEAQAADLAFTEAQRGLRQSVSRGVDPLALARQEIDVDQARLGAVGARRDAGRATQDARAGRAAGIEGSDTVRQATRQLDDARRAAARARRELNEAKHDAQVAANATSGAASALNDQLAGLNRAERRLFDSVRRMQETFRRLFRPITDIIVNSFTRAVDRVNRVLGDARIIQPMRAIARAVARAMDEISRVLTSGPMLDFFKFMGNEAARNIGPVTDILLNLAEIFRNIAVAAAPALRILLDWLAAITKTGAESSRNKSALSEFFIEGTKAAIEFLELGGALIELFFALMGAGASDEGRTGIRDMTEEIQGATDWVREHKEEVRDFFKDSREATGAILKVVFTLGKAMVDVFNAPAVKTFTHFLNVVMIPALTNVVKTVGFFLAPLLKVLSFPIVREITKFIIESLLLGRVIGSVGVLISKFVQFLIRIGVLSRLTTLLTSFIRVLEGPTRTAIAAVVAVLGSLAGSFDDVIGAIGNAIVAVARFIARFTVSIVRAIVSPFNSARRAVARAWDAITEAVGDAWRGIIRFLDRAGDRVLSFITAPFRIAGRLVRGLADRLADIVVNLVTRWRRGFGRMVDAVQSLFGRVKDIFGNIGNFLGDKINDFGRIIGRLPGKISDVFGGLGEKILESMVKGAGDVAGFGRDLVNAFIDILNDAIPNSIDVPGPVGSINMPDSPIPRLAGGGMVGLQGERGQDVIHALLGRGEAVLNWAHQKLVEPALQAVYGFGLPELFDRVRGNHAGPEMDYPYAYRGGYAGARLSEGYGRSVAIPGSPGEFASEKVAKTMAAFRDRFKLFLYDAFATAGHTGAGHLSRGNAADFHPGSGHSWGVVNTAARHAVKFRQQGLMDNIFYDGSLGTTAMQDHGPGHHIHMEFLKGGADKLYRILTGREDRSSRGGRDERPTPRAAAQRARAVYGNLFTELPRDVRGATRNFEGWFSKLFGADPARALLRDPRATSAIERVGLGRMPVADMLATMLRNYNLGDRAAPAPSGSRPTTTGGGAPEGPAGRKSYPADRRGSNLGGPGGGTHSSGEWQNRNAQDLGIPVGTGILAVEDGRISRPIRGGYAGGSRNTDGWKIYLKGASGAEWFYTHNKQALVRAGQRVRAGHKIAVSGAASGVPHLHYAVDRGNPNRALRWPILRRAMGGFVGGMGNLPRFATGGPSASALSRYAVDIYGTGRTYAVNTISDLLSRIRIGTTRAAPTSPGEEEDDRNRRWIRTGFTVDRGNHPKQTFNGGMSFAELLQAGHNRYLRQHSLTKLLGLRDTTGYGMSYPQFGQRAHPILVRRPGARKHYKILKSDVGSGQKDDRRYTTDFHGAIADRIGLGGKGFIEVARAARGGLMGGLRRFQTGGRALRIGRPIVELAEDRFGNVTGTASPRTPVVPIPIGDPLEVLSRAINGINAVTRAAGRALPKARNLQMGITLMFANLIGEGGVIEQMNNAIARMGENFTTALNHATYVVDRAGNFIRRNLNPEQVFQEEFTNLQNTYMGLLGQRGVLATGLVEARRALALARKRRDPKAERAAQNAINLIEEQQRLLEGQIGESIAAIAEAAEARLAAAVEKVNTQTGRVITGLDLEGRLADMTQRAGNIGGAFASRGSILERRGRAMTNQRDQLQFLFSQAVSQGNTELVESLYDQMAELNVAIQENAEALRENTNAYRSALIERISGRGAFQGGVFGSLGNIITTLGALSGTADTSRMNSLLGDTGRVLGETGTGLRGQLASWLGIDLRGLSGTSFVDAIRALNFDAIESGMTDSERQTFENLINAIIENESAVLSNTQQIQELNGQLTEAQSFTSTAWQWMRTAIFDGSGGVLPAYQYPMAATGANVIKTGAAIVHRGEDIRPAVLGPREVGADGEEYHLHVTNPTEVADPDWLARRFAWSLKGERR